MKTNKKTSTKSESYKPYDDIRICNLDEIGISNLETRKTGNLNSTDYVTDMACGGSKEIENGLGI